ncbi:MAG: nucleoside phosphorylase [Bacteroidota bacterium]
MQNQIPASELILNDDNSIYHLHLLPTDIAETIVFVGDQERVPEVSKYFDRIEIQKAKREFVTHTGFIGTKRISVISTGIGTDNIDIVMNELDALVNIDLQTRTIKPNHTALKIIRIGTSGALQASIPIDSVLVSEQAIGLDSLLHFYERETNLEMEASIKQQLGFEFVNPYLVNGDTDLINQVGADYLKGITATCCGFYAPQGRFLKAKGVSNALINKLSTIKVGNNAVTNFEMETAGIYGMAQVLGHLAVSVNCILANRITNEFSTNPAKIVDDTIQAILEKLA